MTSKPLTVGHGDSGRVLLSVRQPDRSLAAEELGVVQVDVAAVVLTDDNGLKA